MNNDLTGFWTPSPDDEVEVLLAGIDDPGFRQQAERELEQAGSPDDRLAFLLAALAAHRALQAPADALGGEDACLATLRARPEYDPDSVRLLGSGGMGRVYLARTRGPAARLVVLKFIRPELRGTRAEARFALEAGAMARLGPCPNLVTLYGYRTARGLGWLEMEYVPGGDLRRRMADGPLPAARAVELLIQVCRGLEHVHASQLIHRDVKPENVLLDGPGPAAAAKLADLGLARLYGAEAAGEAQSAGGTGAYTPPELLGRRGPVGVGADVYAAGVMLHELLTGGRPEPGFPPLRALLHFDVVLHDLVLGAVHPDPANRRYTTAAAFREALERAADQLEPVDTKDADLPVEKKDAVPSVVKKGGINGVWGEAEWERLQEACVDGALAGGLKLMEYYRNALRTQRAESGSLLNPSTLADRAATAAIIRAVDDRLQSLAQDTRHWLLYGAEDAETDRQRETLRRQLPAEAGRRLPPPDQFYQAGQNTLRVIIDGLDGTKNFDRRIPLFCSAVAILVGDEPRAAAVYDPMHHVVYYGLLPGPAGRTEAGAEAYAWEIVTGRRVRLCDYRDGGPDQSAEQAVSLHLTRDKPKKRDELLRPAPGQADSPWARLAELAAGTYELNCGLLSMVHVAARSLGAYANNHAKLVDLAAGDVLVRAAGGLVTTFAGGPLRYDDAGRGTVLAATDPDFHSSLRAVLPGGDRPGA